VSSPAISNSIFLAEMTVGVWAFAAAGFLVAAVVGFAAGVNYAKHAAQRAVERVRKGLASLYGHVVSSIETARSACQMLETFPDLKLSMEQLGRLQEKQSSLLQAVQRIVDGQQVPVEPEPPPAVTMPDMTWVLEPQHAVTKLPDRAAFDANRDMLARLAAESGFSTGLLLVQIDRVDHLKRRFGVAGMQTFTRTMAGLICRSMRDADVACQFAPETFAVLMPGATEAAARETAESIRRTIRHHHFRSSDNGPEVMVTASFGLAEFAGEDGPDLAIARAENALQSSRKQGRNQLFFDSGRSLVACVPSAGTG
jgi:diguanylate cyclase (GGDEF)-like protein